MKKDVIIRKLMKISIVEGIALFILLILSISLVILYFSTHAPKSYVRGETGHICYEKGNVPKNVKHPMYYASLKQCANSRTS